MGYTTPSNAGGRSEAVGPSPQEPESSWTGFGHSSTLGAFAHVCSNTHRMYQTVCPLSIVVLAQLTGSKVRTDLDLDAILAETNELQDRMLEEEDRESIQFEDVAGDYREDPHAPISEPWGQGDRGGPHRPGPTANLTLPAQTSAIEKVPTKEWRSQTPEAVHPLPLTTAEGKQGKKKLSHNAQRRKRKRENNPPQELNSVRLERKRLQKAEKQAVETGIEIRTLKPGLKLPEGCERKVYGLSDLLSKGFAVHRWDGL